MKTHIFSTMPKEFETTIKILEQQIAVPTAQQVMDRLREDADRTEFAKEIGDESTGSALYSHCGGYGKRGERANFGRDRGNDDKEYSCTHCKMNNHTTESCGILKRLNSGAEAEALPERRARKCSASTAENLAIREPNATVASEVSKPETRSTNKVIKTQWRKRIRH